MLWHALLTTGIPSNPTVTLATPLVDTRVHMVIR
ncbi:hypothetical protein LINPERPRIM_LOCUS24202 [Linum perenne]